MALIVQKYGGSSLADSEAIVGVARRIGETHDAGHRVVAVVSAMGDTTDDLAQGDFQRERSAFAQRRSEEHGTPGQQYGRCAEERPQQGWALPDRVEESERGQTQRERERQAEGLRWRKAPGRSSGHHNTHKDTGQTRQEKNSRPQILGEAGC